MTATSAFSSATISELPAQPAPAPRPAALPYLSVRDARAAIDWYAAAFGAVVVGEPMAMDDGRIGHAPMGIDGLAGPGRAGLFRLADGDDEIQGWCPHFDEFVPGFGPEVCGVQSLLFEQGQGLGMNFTFGMRSGGVAAKAPRADLVQDRLAQDGTGGIAGAKEQDIVGRLLRPTVVKEVGG